MISGLALSATFGGAARVAAPSVCFAAARIPLEIGAMERDPVQLRRVYETGRAVAENQIDKIEAFLNDVKETEE